MWIYLDISTKFCDLSRISFCGTLSSPLKPCKPILCPRMRAAQALRRLKSSLSISSMAATPTAASTGATISTSTPASSATTAGILTLQTPRSFYGIISQKTYSESRCALCPMPCALYQALLLQCVGSAGNADSALQGGKYWLARSGPVDVTMHPQVCGWVQVEHSC